MRLAPTSHHRRQQQPYAILVCLLTACLCSELVYRTLTAEGEGSAFPSVVRHRKEIAPNGQPSHYFRGDTQSSCLPIGPTDMPWHQVSHLTCNATVTERECRCAASQWEESRDRNSSNQLSTAHGEKAKTTAQ